MYGQVGLSDGFDLSQIGQGLIDTAANALGIEKGGVIDKTVTTAADVGKKVGVLPGNTSGDGYIDNDTFSTIDKIAGGVKPGGSGGGGSQNIKESGVNPYRTGNNTGTAATNANTKTGGSAVPVVLATPQNLLEKVNPTITGIVVGTVSYFITKRLGLSAAIGGGSAIAQHAYVFNRP